MATVKTCLWFDTQGEEAAHLWTSLIPDSRIDAVMRGPAGTPGVPEGAALTVDFTLGGQAYQILNGGPLYPQTEAASISVTCATQEEADRLWDALTADGGEEGQCGWLKDRFGVSWQIVPEPAMRLFSDYGPEVAAKANAAMLTMRRLDAAAMARAAGIEL